MNYLGTWGNSVDEYVWRIDGSACALRTDGDLKLASMEKGEWIPVQSAPTEGAWDLVNELTAAIESEKPAPCSGEDNLWTLAMSDGVLRSTASGGWADIRM